MWRVTKRIEVAGAHALCLDYKSPCANLHGHNWIIEVTCESEHLDRNGMVIDFSQIKKVVMELDHADLNKLVQQPTAENIAYWIAQGLGPVCTKVMVQESEGNQAWFIR